MENSSSSDSSSSDSDDTGTFHIMMDLEGMLTESPLMVENPSSAENMELEDDFEIISEEYSFSDEGDFYDFCSPSFTPAANKNFLTLNFEEDTINQDITILESAHGDENEDGCHCFLSNRHETSNSVDVPNAERLFSQKRLVSSCQLFIHKTDTPKIDTRISDYPPIELFPNNLRSYSFITRRDGELKSELIGQQSSFHNEQTYQQSFDKNDLGDESASTWKNQFEQLKTHYDRFQVHISVRRQMLENIISSYYTTFSVQSHLLRLTIIAFEIFALGFLFAHTAHSFGWIGYNHVTTSCLPETNRVKSEELKVDYALKFRRQEAVSMVWREKFEELIQENAALQVQLFMIKQQLASDLGHARANIFDLQEEMSSMRFIVQRIKEINEKQEARANEEYSNEQNVET